MAFMTQEIAISLFTLYEQLRLALRSYTLERAIWLSQAVTIRNNDVPSKQLLGSQLSLRNYNAQVGETYAMIKASNKVTGLGTPKTCCVG